MNLRIRLFSPRWLLTGFALCLCGLQPQDARAWSTDLLATPPELTAAVAPNLVLTFDDSGSMGSNFMPDQRPYDPANTGWGNPFRCAGVIDANVTDETNVRSRSMNGVYFNPNNAYDPPIEGDLTDSPSMPAQVWPNALNNGIAHHRSETPNVGLGTIDVTTTRFCGTGGTDPVGAGYYRYRTTAPALTLDANGKITNPATLYTAANWEWISLTATAPALPPGVTLAQARQRFVNWYSYYRTRQLAAISAVSHAYRTFGPEVRVAWQNINSNLITGTTEIRQFELQPTPGGIRDRFYDWLFNIPASGGTPNRSALVRVGDMFQRTSGTYTNPYWDPELNRELVCRQNFHIQMTDGLWNGNAGIAVARADTVATTLPDGTSYAVNTNVNKVFWNEANTAATTMADLAFYYWSTPLRTDGLFAGPGGLKVPPYLPDRTTSLFGPALTSGQDPLTNPEIYWNPANDPARWPHLVQFMIGFGASGTLQNDDATYAKLRGSTATPASVQWPAPNEGTDDGRKIDDMWHAAINSRGKFFISNNPAELAQALVDIVSSITARRATATAATVSLPIITASTESFKASFDTSDWSGNVLKYQVDEITGETLPTTAPDWDAATLLTARTPTSRRIFTWDGASSPRKGISLEWSNLNSAQQAALNNNPATIAVDNDGLGSQRVDYLRGTRTRETTAPFMRRRTTLMGAVINSQPTYVSGPIGLYQDSFPDGSPELLAAVNDGDSYAKFGVSVRNRPPTVYVGSNDGMVHAFDTVTGQERFAYMPSMLITNGKAAEYTNPSHAQLVTGVDSRLRVQDVFIRAPLCVRSPCWRTVLVGSMRLGARGVFALDITDPTTFGPANVLWEFSNTSVGGAALGYTYDSVNIVRLNRGNWATLVSSGYFPTTNLDPRGQPDPATLDPNKDKTSLFVLDLENGNRIAEIQTATAPQGVPLTFGLSTPGAYDLQGDQIDDIAVAGDLVGNLFRFDLTNTNPASWTVDLMFKTYTTTPTQVTEATLPRQPITSMPVAFRNAAGPIWVFGTGKYLGKEDRTATGIASNVGPQAIYGVPDAARALLPSALTTQVLTQSSTSRTLTTNAATANGWKILLDIAAEPGERVVFTAKPIFSLNYAVINTLIPRGSDPCSPTFRGASIVVDAASGGAPVILQSNDDSGATRPPIIVQPPLPCEGDKCRDPTPRIVNGEFKLPTTGATFTVPTPPPHRGSWRELLEIL